MKSSNPTQNLRLLKFNPEGHQCYQDSLKNREGLSLKVISKKSQLKRVLDDFQPHLMIYCAGDKVAEAHSLLDKVLHQKPQLFFVLVFNKIDPKHIAGLFNAGAYDIVEHGQELQFQTLLQRCKRDLERRNIQATEGNDSYDPGRKPAKSQPHPASNNLFISGSLAEIIWTANSDGLLNYMSDSAKSFFGKDYKRLFGNYWMNYVYQEDLPRVQDAWREAQKNQAYYNEEFRIADKNQQYKWMRLTATPQFNQNGKITSWAGLAVNIHKGKVAQHKLEKTTQELKNILEGITDSFISLNRNWEVRAWNLSAELLFNISSEAAIGKKFWRLLKSIELPGLQQAMLNAYQSQKITEDTINLPQRNKYLAFTVYPKENGMSLFFSDITEKINQEENLNRERERLKRAQQTASIGDFEYFFNDEHGSWSDEAYRIFDLNLSQPVPSLKDSIDKYFPHEREIILRTINEAINTRKKLSVNASLKKSDGSLRHVKLIGSVTFKDDQPHKLVGTIQDITQQRSYEMALQKSEEQLNRIANNIRGVVTQHWHKPDGSIVLTYVSKGVERIYGYGVDEVLGRDSLMQEAVHPEDAELMDTLFKEKSLTMSPIELEFRITNKSKQQRWLHMVSVPSEHEKGGTIWDCTIWDITDSKESEMELRKAKQLYQKLFENSPLPIVIYNPCTLKIIEVNTKATSLYGFSREEFLQLSLDQLRPADKDNTLSMVRKYAQHGDLESQSVHLTKQGKTIHVDLHGVNLDYQGQKARQLYIKDMTAVKKAHEELDYQKFALDQHAMVSVTDSSGKIVYVNENFAKISGFSIDELLGKNHRLMNSNYHGISLFKNMYRTIEAGKVWKGEFKNKRPDDSFYWINMTVIPFLSEGDKTPSRFVAISTDITERKKAEASLQKERARLEAAINGTDAGLFDWNMRNHTITINSNYAQALGYSKNEFTPANLENIMAIINPADHPKIKKALSLHILGYKDFYECEFRARHKNGSEIWLFARGKITNRNTQNTPWRMIGTQINITDHKLKQQELDRVRINQNALINNLDDTIWSVDRSLNYLSFNRAFANSMARSTGVEPREGTSLLSLLDPTEEAMWLKYYKKVLNGHPVSFAHSYAQYDSHFQFILNPIKSDSNEVTGVACYGKNITDTTNYLNSIKEQNEELRNISIMQSHEVRAPLARVLGLAQLVEQNIDREESLKMMVKACKELDEVIAKVVKQANSVEQRMEKRHLRREAVKASRQKN